MWMYIGVNVYWGQSLDVENMLFINVTVTFCNLNVQKSSKIYPSGFPP